MSPGHSTPIPAGTPQNEPEQKLSEIRAVVIAYVRSEVACGEAMHEIECILHGWTREVSR